MQKEIENVEAKEEKTTRDVPLYGDCLLFVFEVKDLSVFVYRHIPVSSS